jgi:deoxyribonuclease V
MILIFDVDYHDDGTALVAVVGIESWDSAETVLERTLPIPETASYEPGYFYKRELPCIMAMIRDLHLPAEEIDCLVVDGHCWLDEDRPGLGAHLYEKLHRLFPVVGIAKSRFHMGFATEVFRPGSTKPLYVTAEGLYDAPGRVSGMHGSYRIPTALKRVDALCRGREEPSQGKFTHA